MSDLRDAWRALRTTPIISSVAVLSLALGIGANAAIFSLLNGILLRSLPVKDPHQLAVLTTRSGSRAFWIDSWTYPIWEQLRQHQRLFAGAAAWSHDEFDSAPAGQRVRVPGLWVSGGFFEVLGVPAIRGRTITSADDARGGGPEGPAAMISYEYWQTRFGGRTDAIGAPITLNRVAFTIVGVTPPGFFGLEVGQRFDVAIPIGAEPLFHPGAESWLGKRSYWWLNILVRRRPGQTPDAAAAAIRGIQPEIRRATLPDELRPQDRPNYLRHPFELLPAATGTSRLRDRYVRPLFTMMVVVGLVLLIACANVANLLLARAAARRREISVRRALGASSLRIARQFFAESLLLAAIGAIGGLGFAAWGSHLLLSQLSTRTRVVFVELPLDWRVLGFTAAVAIGTALLFGTTPALRARGIGPGDALKERGRGIASGGRLAFGSALLVLQVTLSLVLVVAAGLFVRTFATLARQPLGFDRDAVLIARVEIPPESVEPADRPALFARLADAAATVPGVSRAAASVVTPISGSTWQFTIDFPDGPDLPERERGAHVNLVTDGFFATYGTRLLAGRDFGRGDTSAAPPVAIVNQAFAQKFFGGANPLGRRVKQVSSMSAGATHEIVGYVGDAAYRSLRQTVPPTLYLPFAQYAATGRGLRPAVSVSVRAAAGSPALLTRAIADALRRTAPDVSLSLLPLAEQVSGSLVQERLIAIVAGFFGALALLLAALGLYGMTAYAVSRRRAEIGIRMALGAAPARVIRLVMRRLAVLIAIGVLLGTLGSLSASRFVGALLYGLEPRDPSTLAGAAALLVAVSALAGWMPARRASKIDPAAVLREG
ncbi:MAG TPA: ABC transporter permease [Vicinamibacterales bacterium]|nr:ABC transporter permease [Vicinamibacterales bacterium]